MKKSIKALLTTGKTLQLIRVSPYKVSFVTDNQTELQNEIQKLLPGELSTHKIEEVFYRDAKAQPWMVEAWELTFTTDKPREKLKAPRKIIKTQTNAIQFEGGSWLYFDTPAAYSEHTKNGFIVWQWIEDGTQKRIWELEYIFI